MLIGIDASKTALKHKTGIDNTVYQIILNLEKIDKKNVYSLYSNKPIDKSLKQNKNFQEKLIPFPRLWNKFRLPLALMRDRPEKFLQVTNAIPAFSPQKTAVFIHDLAFKFFPKAYSPYELMLQEAAIKVALNKAARIIFSSEANKKDFLKFHTFPEEKINVVPLAFDSNIYKKISKPKQILKVNSPYLIFVGRLEKRKNIINIIEAFVEFKKKSKTDHKLVLVGKKGYGYDEIEAKINENKNFKKDIITTGYMSDQKLANLYALSDGLIFPSLYEGFGLPILEAMACGIPVITSNIPTSKEVAGDAAILVNPENVSEISEAINSIVFDKKIKQNLISKGKIQIKRFSWNKTAKNILKILEEI
ncbi:MAG: glycosyltransferase family 1 protein [Patescibacteria group bacterium]